jgi:hypothetical protein
MDGISSAYSKIPQVALEKACDALTRGFSEPFIQFWDMHLV